MTELAVKQDIDSLLSQKVEVLLSQVEKMPQVDCQTKHYFGPSIYIREVTMPAGAVVIGKPHKKDHMCVMLQGRMIIIDASGIKKELVAPMTFVGSAGRKVAYILETTVFQNILATDETDIDVLENMLVDNTQPMLEGE
jgi:hypothetical protein